MTAAPAAGLVNRASALRLRIAERAKPLTALWITLLTYTVFTVSRIHAYYPILARLRPILVLFVLAVFFAVVRPRMLHLSNLTRQWPGRVLIALAILANLSALFGISLGHSALFIIQDYSKTLIFCGMLMLAFRDWQDVSRLVWAYVISAAIISFMSLAVYDISKAKGSLGYDANDVALVVLVGLPLSILTFQTSKTVGKLVSALTLVGIVVTIAKSSSRGGFLGLLVVAAALLVALKGVSVAKRVLAVVVVAAALALGARSNYWTFIDTILHPTQDYNWDARYGRREEIKRGIGYMLSYPVFGVGVGNFPMAEGTISDIAKNAAYGEGVAWRTAHNSYVLVGAEMGIPGLLLWSGLVLGSIVGCFRLRRRMPERWLRGTPDERFLYLAATAIPIAMMGFATSGFFLSHSYTDEVYVLAALVCGFNIEVGRRLRAAPAAPSAGRREPKRAPQRPRASRRM